MDVEFVKDVEAGPSINLLDTDGDTLIWAEEDFVTLNLTQVSAGTGYHPVRLYSHCWRQAPLTAICVGTGRVGSSDPRPQDFVQQPVVVAANKYAVVVWRARACNEAISRGEHLPEGMPVLTDVGPVDALSLSTCHSANSANMLAVCAGTCVHVIELATLKHAYRLEGHAAPVLCAAFCEPHAPHLLATAGEDRSLMVWDLKQGSLVYQSPILTAAALTSIAVDPSHLRVAVGAADGVVRVFDLAAAPACRCLQVLDLAKQLQRTADQAASAHDAVVAAASAGPKVVRAPPAWTQHFQDQDSLLQADACCESQDDLTSQCSASVLRIYYSPLRTSLPDGDTGLLAEAPRLLAGSMRALAVLDSSSYFLLHSHFFRNGGLVTSHTSPSGAAKQLPEVSAARAFAFGLDPQDACVHCCIASAEGIAVVRLVPQALPGMADLAAAEQAQRYGPGLSDGLPPSQDCIPITEDVPGSCPSGGTDQGLVRGKLSGGRLAVIEEEQGFMGGRKQWGTSNAGVVLEDNKNEAGTKLGRRLLQQQQQQQQGPEGGAQGQGWSSAGSAQLPAQHGQGKSGSAVTGAAATLDGAFRGAQGQQAPVLLSVFQSRPLPDNSPLRDPSLKKPLCQAAAPCLARSNSTPAASHAPNKPSGIVNTSARGGRVHSASPMRNRGSKQPIVFHKQIKSSGYGFVQPPVRLGRPPPPPVKLPAQPIPTSNVSRHLLQARSYPVTCDPPLIHQERNCLPNEAAAHHGAISRLQYSSDASRLLTVSTDKTARVMRLPLSKYQGEGTDLLGHNAGLISGDWSMDGTMVLTASADRSARLWNASCAHPLMLISHSTHSAPVDAQLPSAASSSAVPPRKPFLPASRPNLPAASKPSMPAVDSNSIFLHEVTAARFYYQDQFILLSCGNKLSLYRYKLADGDITDDIARLKATSKYRLAASHTSTAQNINNFSAANSFLSPIALLAGSNRGVEVVDCTTMQTAATIPETHARPVHTIIQSTNASLYTSHPREASELFVTAACDGALKLWDLRVCRCVRTFSGHQNTQITVGAAFSPCLRFLACGSEDQAAYVYDIRQGSVLSRLGRHGSAVTDVAFNPLHPQLAVGTQGGSTHFYSDDGC